MNAEKTGTTAGRTDRKKKSQGRPKAKPFYEAKPKGTPGLGPRILAAHLVSDVLDHARSFDDARKAAFEAESWRAMSGPDKGLAQLISATVLRMQPILEDIVDAHLNRPLPSRHKAIQTILLCASAQLLFLKTPPHAAISLAVEQARHAGRKSPHLAGLVNAILRKVATNGPEMLRNADVTRRAIPDWLWQRWTNTYGETRAHEIASASLSEAPLDITVKADANEWAEKLDATILKTGSLRRLTGGRVEELAGYEDGKWWIQDAAAAIPARLLDDIEGKTVIDLCAAPGGKTAQLAVRGANVVAVDNDEARIPRLQNNLARLNLSAKCVVADILNWKPGRTFDFILLDAPCTATGTIRRHPDILRLKRGDDIALLARKQSKLLLAAYALLSPSGTLIYCTCSLEPEEGEYQIREFLSSQPAARISPITPGECGIKQEWITSEGFLRTLPCHDPYDSTHYDESIRKSPDEIQMDNRIGGIDGFFAARIIRDTP